MNVTLWNDFEKFAKQEIIRWRHFENLDTPWELCVAHHVLQSPWNLLYSKHSSQLYDDLYRLGPERYAQALDHVREFGLWCEESRPIARKNRSLLPLFSLQRDLSLLALAVCLHDHPVDDASQHACQRVSLWGHNKGLVGDWKGKLLTISPAA